MARLKYKDFFVLDGLLFCVHKSSLYINLLTDSTAPPLLIKKYNSQCLCNHVCVLW